MSDTSKIAMSKTPITDAKAFYEGNAELVSADDARQLELELNDVNAAVQKCLEVMNVELNPKQQELAELKAKRLEESERANDNFDSYERIKVLYEISFHQLAAANAKLELSEKVIEEGRAVLACNHSTTGFRKSMEEYDKAKGGGM